MASQEKNEMALYRAEQMRQIKVDVMWIEFFLIKTNSRALPAYNPAAVLSSQRQVVTLLVLSVIFVCCLLHVTERNLNPKVACLKRREEIEVQEMKSQSPNHSSTQDTQQQRLSLHNKVCLCHIMRDNNYN